jgi:predicted flavoprotein YhiN
VPAALVRSFSREDLKLYSQLAGVSAEAGVATAGAAFRGKLLFTHRGLSGPAVLQTSSYWKRGEPLIIDLMPGIDFAAVLKESRAANERSEARTIAARLVPARLAELWFERRAGSKPAAMLSDRDIQAAAQAFHQWPIVQAPKAAKAG